MTNPVMLYVANLKRNGLLKVGVSDRLEVRRSELRRALKAPRLQFIIEAHVPHGWGTETQWERRLLAALRQLSGRLQLFSDAENSEEVVDALPADARRELHKMRAKTEVNAKARAETLPDDREDWRFYSFFERSFPEAEYSTSFWRRPLYRQLFLYELRGEPLDRATRHCFGLPTVEADEFAEAEWASGK